MDRFVFLHPGNLTDGCLRLILLMTEITHDAFWTTPTPTYRFEIQKAESGERVGRINLRVGDWHVLTQYTGNIGYAIDEPHRGHHYAECACRLLLPFAALNKMPIVWITCAPDNLASRRTLERLGCELVETIDLPADYPLPEGTIRQKCRFRIDPADLKDS
jgi:tagatose 1,6-diphosphate aldolase